MTEPPTGKSAHRDSFVRDNLPPKPQWPKLLFDLPELDYAPQTNVATELLDKTINEHGPDRPLIHTPQRSYTYGEIADLSDRIARVLVHRLEGGTETTP